jgi:hypothetical protein
MPVFNYADLTDSRTMTYKTFDRHHQSFERREKQLERGKVYYQWFDYEDAGIGNNYL